MGDKVAAKQAMARPACPACPAPKARCPTTEGDHPPVARSIGYPVIIKAAGGGGGRGMRVVHTEAALLHAVQTTRAEAGRPSATRRSTWRSSSRTRATSRSRCWPTAQERGVARRARMLDPAPPPEGDRRGAGAGHSCAA